MTEPAGAQTPLIPRLDSYYRWDEPESDITVFLNPEAVDQLQLAAWRAIDSDPGARAEVGGVLLGTVEPDEGRVRIVVENFETIRCQQPLYRPASREMAAVAAAVARGKTRRGRSAVGYYRTHNRNGLFLAPEDLQLIQKHFPGPENVFLLIKTLPNRACTAGFFFWNCGRIQPEFTGSEVPLVPTWISRPHEDPDPSAVVESAPASPSVGTEAGSEDRPGHLSPNGATVRYVMRYRVPILALTGIAIGCAFLGFRYPGQLLGRNAPVDRAAVKRVPSPASAKPEILPASTQPAAGSAPAAPARQPAAAKPGLATPFRTEPAKSPARAVEKARVPFVPPPNIPSGRTAEEAPVPLAPAEAAPQVPAAAAIVAQIPLVQPPPPETPVAPVAARPRPEADSSTARNAAAPRPSTFMGAQVIHQVTPSVPRDVRPRITTDIQVDVEVAIDEAGRVTDARVASTRGAAAGLLTIEAMKAARLFRFRPAQRDGHNVPSQMVLTFDFAGATK